MGLYGDGFVYFSNDKAQPCQTCASGLVSAGVPC